MQSITPVTPAQLLAAGQQPKLKFELFVDPYWVNICDGFSFLLSPCDATTGWTGTSLSIDTSDKKEGMGSLKDTIAAPVINTVYNTIYNPAGSWDLSSKKHLLFWLKSDRPSTAFTYERVNIYDTSGNWRYWNLTFSAGEWTAFKLLLSTGDVESGTPPDLALINGINIYFKAADTTSFYKKIDYLRIDDVASGLKGKNYLEDWSISLGGAGMSPSPVGGIWGVTLSNEDGIFHPKHPTSAYIDYLKTGRKARLSIGGKYSAVDYYWQRVIGYIDEPRFEAGNQKINISGADYMKLLEDTEFGNLDNYWGASETFNSISSDGLTGIELYNEADAMDITGEADNVAHWVQDEVTFTSVADGGGSTYVGKAVTTDEEPYVPTVVNDNIFVPVAGKEYWFNFKYKKVSGAGVALRVLIRQFSTNWHDLSQKEELYKSVWTEESIRFTAQTNDPIEIWLEIYDGPIGSEIRVDQFSIHEFKPYEERYYQLPSEAKGPYRVLLKPNATWEDVWEGEEDEGWGYEEATRRVFFDINKTVAVGVDNLVIHYFTQQEIEDVLARILFQAGLYADEATAKAAIIAAPEYVDPNVQIDKAWFKVGSTCLDAVRMICERCDYRFYFTWDGIPTFKAKPSYSDALTDGGLNIWTTATNLTYWTEYKEGTSTINREATEKVEGDYSCRFDVDASNSQVQIYQMNISLTPLKRRKVIIWYKNSVAGKTFQFYIRNIGNNVYLKEDGTWNVGSYYITLPNSIVWTAYELPFYVHPDYSSYLMLLREKLAASSSFYFDKLSIWREEFTFSDQKHIASFSNYQAREEIKNRVIIEGIKQTRPISEEETLRSALRGEAHNDASITAYGERSLTIKNHLFQTQASIDAMCASLLAEYKDPKWYTDVEVPFNPVPLEMGDRMGWKERLSPVLEITQEGVIRDIKINKFNTTYRCEKK